MTSIQNLDKEQAEIEAAMPTIDTEAPQPRQQVKDNQAYVAGQHD